MWIHCLGKCINIYAIIVVILFLVFFLNQLTSLPEGQDNSIKFNINSKTPYVTSPLKPEVTYSCKRQVDPQTGLIGIALNFSYEYNRLIQQAISMYTVDALHTAPINNIGSYVYDPAFVSKVGIVDMRLPLYISRDVYLDFVPLSVCYTSCRVFWQRLVKQLHLKNHSKMYGVGIHAQHVLCAC